MHTPKKKKSIDGFYPKSQYEDGNASALDSGLSNCLTQTAEETTFFSQTDKRVKIYKNLVNFNVGGVKYTTTLSTIANDKDSNLYKYSYATINGFDLQSFDDSFDGYFNFTDSNSGGIVTIFIDRDGKIFQYVLNYLRDGDLICPEDPFIYQSILSDAKFYKMKGLTELVLRKIDPNCCLKPKSPMSLDLAREVDEVSTQKTQLEITESISLTQFTSSDLFITPHNVFLTIEENVSLAPHTFQDNIEESIPFVQTTPIRLLGEETFSTTADF